MTTEGKHSWKTRILEELQTLSITVLYLWVLLAVFALHREMILAHYHINYSRECGFALINAVILAKFMWLGELLHAGQRAAQKPLWFSVILNSAIFTAILMVCHILEESLVRVWRGQSSGQSLAESGGVSLRDAFTTGIIMFVVLIPFFLAKGLIQILGKSEVKTLLFRTTSKSIAVPAKEE